MFKTCLIHDLDFQIGNLILIKKLKNQEIIIVKNQDIRVKNQEIRVKIKRLE